MTISTAKLSNDCNALRKAVGTSRGNLFVFFAFCVGVISTNKDMQYTGGVVEDRAI